MRKLIIGAGPAGLCAAIELRRAGVNVIVLDPRADNYERPGHVSPSSFWAIQEMLGLKFWPQDTRGHIKDLERKLYQEAQKLGITIEKKRFLRLHEHTMHRGVVVANEKGEEEIIEADYVFDCTGSRRAVIKSVNQIAPDSPLKLTTFADLPTHNHFIAYVKMSSDDLMKLIFAKQYNFRTGSLVSLIIKLRALGWKEFEIPRCTGVPFGNNKACVYVHAPENLKKEQYGEWVQTVLECYVKPINYEQLPASPKSKPRFLPFTTNAQALQESSYQGKNLPTVIALGDSQIDADYYLGHGVHDAIERIHALLKCLIIADGEIKHFDAAKYRSEMEVLFDKHKKAIINQAQKEKQERLTALINSQAQFKEAASKEKNPQRLDEINIIMQEIQEKIPPLFYQIADTVFSQCRNAGNSANSADINKAYKELKKLRKLLVSLGSNLNISFAKTQEILSNLMVNLKEIGNAFNKEKNYVRAAKAYGKILEIYNSFQITDKQEEKLVIYSNLIIVLMRAKSYEKAITVANEALIFSIFNTKSDVVKAKIVFNFARALCHHAQAHLKANNPTNAEVLYTKAEDIIRLYQEIIPTGSLQEIKTIMSKLKEQMDARLDKLKQNKSPAPVVKLSMLAAKPKEEDQEELYTNNVVTQ